MRILSVVVWALCISSQLADAQQPTPAELRIVADFPGGSARVLEIDSPRQYVRLAPAEHPNRGWVCWWFAKIENLRPGEPLHLDVGDAPWATPDRAAWSIDGVEWRQTPPGERDGKRILYSWTIGSDTAWVAWGPPFVPSDADRIIAAAVDKCGGATAFELCKTRERRPVPAIRFQQPASAASSDVGSERYGIWIQARQHAWESGSSWVCKGFLDWLASDHPRAASMRGMADVTIVPIMDVDSVAIGAGGKNQFPHDHNRDWTDQPHWESVIAAMKSIREQDDAGRFDVFVDLHNPGASTKRPFFYLPPPDLTSPLTRRNLDRFLAAARHEMTGPLQFTGDTQESGAAYDPNWKAISKNWVTMNTRDHVVAVTLETAWNTSNSTTEGYETVGRQLGLAIERYLRTGPRAKP